MRVCYLFQDRYPWDIRVEKILNSLAEHGIESHIVSRNRDDLVRKERIRRSIYVHRTPSCANSYFADFISFPAFFSPIWINAVLSVVKGIPFDLIIVRDLPLAPTALMAGRLASLPVIMDMAENYPAMIRDTWKYRGPKGLDRIVRNPWALMHLEKIVVPKLDGVLVVSEFSRDRIKEMGRDDRTIWVVRNTPRTDELNQHDELPINSDIRSLSKYLLLYVGGLEESRGLETVIRALPEVKGSINDVKFIIVGKGTSESRLKTLAHQLGMSHHVVFKGWVNPELIPAIIRSVDVCLIPHFVTEHTQTTIPNKIFDYMAQKKPVITADAEALVQIVESSHCGMFYPHRDHGYLADLIIKLNDHQLRKRLGQSGYDAVKAEFNWGADEKILLSAVREVAALRKY